MAKTSILVAGAGGRMGRAVVAEILRTPGASLAGGFERPGGADIGKDIGVLAGLDALGLEVEDAAAKGLARAGALIDFTAPAASVENVKAAAEYGVAHVIGTTGFSAADEAAIAEAAKAIPIVKSGNMSVGVNILTALVEKAAAALGGVVGGVAGLVAGVPFLPAGLVVGPPVGAAIGAAATAAPFAAAGAAMGGGVGLAQGLAEPAHP